MSTTNTEETKYTPWFDGKTDRPGTHGVWQVKPLGAENDDEAEPKYRHFNTEYWGPEADTPERAEQIGFMRSSDQEPTWRGLAEDPNAAPQPNEALTKAVEKYNEAVETGALAQQPSE